MHQLGLSILGECKADKPRNRSPQARPDYRQSEGGTEDDQTQAGTRIKVFRPPI